MQSLELAGICFLSNYPAGDEEEKEKKSKKCLRIWELARMDAEELLHPTPQQTHTHTLLSICSWLEDNGGKHCSVTGLRWWKTFTVSSPVLSSAHLQ